jgi:hypothetical protein
MVRGSSATFVPAKGEPDFERFTAFIIFVSKPFHSEGQFPSETFALRVGLAMVSMGLMKLSTLISQSSKK